MAARCPPFGLSASGAEDLGPSFDDSAERWLDVAHMRTDGEAGKGEGEAAAAAEAKPDFERAAARLGDAAQEMQLLVDLCDHVQASTNIGVRHANKARTVASVSAEARESFAAKRQRVSRAVDVLRAGAVRLRKHVGVRRRFAAGLRALRKRWLLSGLVPGGVIADVAPPGVADADGAAHAVTMADDGALRLLADDLQDGKVAEGGEGASGDLSVSRAHAALERCRTRAYASMLLRHIHAEREARVAAVARGEGGGAPAVAPDEVADLTDHGSVDLASLKTHAAFVQSMRDGLCPDVRPAVK